MAVCAAHRAEIDETKSDLVSAFSKSMSLDFLRNATIC